MKRIDRYEMHELISVHTPVEQFEGYRQFATELWRGHDEVLDRPVSIRLLRKDDARLNHVLGAARAAALVDDRRLLRILDVIDVPGAEGEQTRTAVVSEWANGQHLGERLADGTLFEPTQALEVIVEISRTLARCAAQDVGHGRLRPSCVLWTEAGEVRIRGLSVDAALFGPIDPAAPDADVDGLGGLLYAMVTGRWPALNIDPHTVHIPLAPATGRSVPMPSRVRAGVPVEIDDLVTRSVRQVSRPRGSLPITSVEGFATSAGSAIDYLAPLADTSRLGARLRAAATTSVLTPTAGSASAATRAGTGRSADPSDAAPPRKPRTSSSGIARRIGGIVVAAAAVYGIGWLGWQQLTSDPAVQEQDRIELQEILEFDAVPFVENFDSGITAVLPIQDVRSYNPLEDQTGDGRPDGAAGRERNPIAGRAIDADASTAWLTRKYRSPNFGTRSGNKAGVGLIVDLGTPREISTVELGLVGFGTDLDVRVADQILDDPNLWTEFASVKDAGPEITLRSPRRVTGQYVLIWLTGLPAIPGTSGTDNPRYQGGISKVSITGNDPQDVFPSD
jgi:hypothetical protein